jgi:uncharacterized membrane protein
MDLRMKKAPPAAKLVLLMQDQITIPPDVYAIQDILDSKMVKLVARNASMAQVATKEFSLLVWDTGEFLKRLKFSINAPIVMLVWVVFFPHAPMVQTRCINTHPTRLCWYLVQRLSTWTLQLWSWYLHQMPDLQFG